MKLHWDKYEVQHLIRSILNVIVISTMTGIMRMFEIFSNIKLKNLRRTSRLQAHERLYGTYIYSVYVQETKLESIG